jgi:hypothetical protein
VLRDEEATLDVVSYIVLNPVKPGLCADERSTEALRYKLGIRKLTRSA